MSETEDKQKQLRKLLRELTELQISVESNETKGADDECEGNGDVVV